MSNATLYHGEPNGPSLSVLAALEESGLDISCKPISLAAGERHSLPGITDSTAMDFAVEGEGPVLVIDGEAMSEAVFIAQYFDEQEGGCGLQPADPYARWQMLMWCRQTTERLSPAAAYLGLNAATAPDFTPEAIKSDDLRMRWQDWQQGRFDEAKLADSRAKVAQFAQRIEDQLADGRAWLMGSFSIADLETFAWIRSMRHLEAAAFSGKGALDAWLERVESRPSVQAALARSVSGEPERAFAPGPEINRWG